MLCFVLCHWLYYEYHLPLTQLNIFILPDMVGNRADESRHVIEVNTDCYITLFSFNKLLL